MTVIERTIEIPGLSLAARIHGPEDGMPVIALHGWLDNAASFEPLVELLPDYDWIALDFVGHGHSAHRPPNSWYHYVDYLDDVHCALRELGWDTCTLIGHSLGGAVASAFAAAWPERIERLVMIESPGPIAGKPGKSLDTLRTGLRERITHDASKLRLFPSLDSAVAARRAAGGLSDAVARLLMQRNLVEHADGMALRSDPRLKLTSPVRIHEDIAMEWLAGIACPTLAIGADPIFPGFDEAVRTRRMAQVPDLRFVLLPGNHHLHMETPAPVAAEIAAFLG